jgi:hypothetical protein
MIVRQLLRTIDPFLSIAHTFHLCGCAPTPKGATNLTFFWGRINMK